jgi:hypothetical protein
MQNTEHLTQTATRPDLAMAIDMDATLFVALELSLSSWVVVASAPRLPFHTLRAWNLGQSRPARTRPASTALRHATVQACFRC